MNSVRLYSLFGCIFFILFLSSCRNPSTSYTQIKKTITFGMLPADAPFMAVNEHGEYEGFDVDVAREIGKVLDRPIRIIDLGMAELFIALDRKKIDVLMCGLSITTQRRERFNLVHYQGHGVKTFPLVFWNQAPANIGSMEDLRGHNITIAVLPGTLQEGFAQQFDFVKTKAINTYADIILELQYKKVDAALFDEAIESFVKQFPQFRVINVPLGDFESHGHGIALHKTNSELTQQIEQAIQTLKNNGTIARLEKVWQMNGENND